MKYLNHRVSSLVTAILFIVLFVWWLSLSPFDSSPENEHARFVWGAFYQLIAIWGGISGLIAASVWGGGKSIIGKSLLMLSCGLLLQAFGQSVYSFYNLFAQVEAPYPSLGDVGFFGSVLFYIYGAILLIKASGSNVSMRRIPSLAIAIIFPVLMLLFSYLEFLQEYEIDWAYPLQVFLDFGYPLGQAFYVSLAIVVLVSSYRILGGIMRLPIIMLLIALVAQYFADFNFLFQFSRETWYVAGYGDILYMLAYTVMALGLIQFGVVYKRMRTDI